MQQLRQRVIASYHLGPLDADETRAYIEHRMKQVGWKGDPKFEDEVFPLVHAYTGGIPRRINTLCTRALLGAYLSESHVITPRGVEGVISEFSEEFGETVADMPPTGKEASFEPGLSGGAALATLEKRIVGVEKAMHTTVNLLRQLIRLRQPGEGRFAERQR
jgi:general secretion pathway protein A